VVDRSVRVGPLLGHQAAVSAQDRGRGGQAVTAQWCGEAADQHGEQGSVGPVQVRARVGSAEYRDFVAQTRSSTSLDDDAPPSSISQPRSRSKIR
jgi:hypothetical protein